MPLNFPKKLENYKSAASPGNDEVLFKGLKREVKEPKGSTNNL